ncbi:MAG: outer membrane beta-barrel protein [Bacteroidales bacterium]
MIFIALSIFTVSAQEQIGFSVHVGGVFPFEMMRSLTTNHSVNETTLNGGATFGASIGLKYTYKFQETGWEDSGNGIFVSADLLWNEMNKKSKTFYKENDKIAPRYFHIPILLGYNYTYELGMSDIVSVFGQLGLGVDMFKRTKEGWPGDITKYDMSYAFAADVGVGLVFIDRVSIGIHFNWLGQHKIKISGKEYSSGEYYMVENSSNIVLKAGFHF